MPDGREVHTREMVSPTSGPADSILDWEGDVVLADGATVHMRAMVPGDESLLTRMYEGLSADSVYYRFFSPVPSATATALEMNRLGDAGHVTRLAQLGDERFHGARALLELHGLRVDVAGDLVHRDRVRPARAFPPPPSG